MVEEAKDATARFLAIGLAESAVTNLVKNKKATESLIELLDQCEISECPKEKGALLQALATKLKPAQMQYKKELGMQIKNDKWRTTLQLDEGINFVKNKMASEGKGYAIDFDEMDKETGVGVVISDNQITEAIEAAF